MSLSTREQLRCAVACAFSPCSAAHAALDLSGTAAAVWATHPRCEGWSGGHHRREGQAARVTAGGPARQGPLAGRPAAARGSGPPPPLCPPAPGSPATPAAGSGGDSRGSRNSCAAPAHASRLDESRRSGGQRGAAWLPLDQTIEWRTRAAVMYSPIVSCRAQASCSAACTKAAAQQRDPSMGQRQQQRGQLRRRGSQSQAARPGSPRSSSGSAGAVSARPALHSTPGHMRQAAGLPLPLPACCAQPACCTRHAPRGTQRCGGTAWART